jgi:hypothetical protein
LFGDPHVSDWLSFLDDQRPITAIFGEAVPALNGVTIHELTVNYNGGYVLVNFDLPEFPKDPPKKWVNQGFNVVRVELAVYGVQQLSIDGWQAGLAANMALDQDVDLVRISISADEATAVTAGTLVYVQKISAYLNGALE